MANLTIPDPADAGTVIPAKTLILRKFIGTAGEKGKGYQIESGMDGSPLIRSDKTGKWFSLSWGDVIALALAKGIDEP